MSPEEAVNIYARIWLATKEYPGPPFVSTEKHTVTEIFNSYMQYLGHRSRTQQIEDVLAEEAGA